jgi:hypothetical protein
VIVVVSSFLSRRPTRKKLWNFLNLICVVFVIRRPCRVSSWILNGYWTTIDVKRNCVHVFDCWMRSSDSCWVPWRDPLSWMNCSKSSFIMLLEMKSSIVDKAQGSLRHSLMHFKSSNIFWVPNSGT